MTASKSKIDKSGRVLANSDNISEEDQEFEDVFDEYRKIHLKPLSSTTLELQNWLKAYEIKYYIAQRLKRKPQILRKLNRFNVRLTQLQDIGGLRIIVESNSDVNKIVDYLEQKMQGQKTISIVRKTDYRGTGRDDSGYRALHLILERDNLKLELQIRSRIQHYWAELIERTSVVYGHYIKELAGAPEVINYFKNLSDLFSEIESGRQPDLNHKFKVEQSRNIAEAIIESSDKKQVLNSHVNEGIVKTLIDKEKSLGKSDLNNWLFVFNWNYASFVSWDVVSLEPEAAIKAYTDAERTFPSEDGFEVVLVGSSEVATVRETHSHYFGLNHGENLLETLEESIIGFSKKMDIDIGARQILAKLNNKKFWNKKAISVETLKNHFCKDIITFDSSLNTLLEKSLVQHIPPGGGIALNLKKKNEIDSYLK